MLSCEATYRPCGAWGIWIRHPKECARKLGTGRTSSLYLQAHASYCCPKGRIKETEHWRWVTLCSSKLWLGGLVDILYVVIWNSFDHQNKKK